VNIREQLAALAPSTRVDTRIPVGNTASGAEVSIPVVLARGVRPGPCLWINGQVHGDELNGVFAALDFIRNAPLQELSGSVLVTATANPWALDARRKRTPNDDLDLDQSFPGNPSGLTTERTAAALTQAIDGAADALISLHTMGTPFECPPFAVYKLTEPPKVDEKALLRLISQFRPDCACWMPVHLRPGELPGHLAGAIDWQMLQAGKPAFMIELGAGGRCTPEHVRQGVEGLYGAARLLGLLDGKPLAAASVIKVSRYQHVTCSGGGLFRALVRPGSVVSAGTAWGEIIDLHGHRVETAVAANTLRVVGVRREPVVHSGDRIGFVAHEWDEVRL
jgi:predicted deacylase